MLKHESTIRGYFSAPADCFWQWQSDGDEVGWRDGKLIAFDIELTSILKHLAPEGLPRFGALLLLIAATRKNWAVDGSEAGLLAGILCDAQPKAGDQEQALVDALLRRKKAQTKDAQQSRSEQHQALLERVLTGLHKVRALDSSLREKLEAKAALASIVFEDREPVVAPRYAPRVADAIRPGLLALIALPSDERSPETGPILLLRDLAELAQGLERVTPEAVRLRLETGLDALPAPAAIGEELEQLEEIAPSDAARAVIQEMLDSPEHAGMARLAKQLLASTALPRKLSESHEQEMGGYSDIANRGTPDRLLISELAQDGLTLAVRVAMNEAMYLHRETPPSNPRLRRQLLIDSGVRAWGVPRVFAGAAALAFAANTPKGASIDVWRGSGAELKEVDLSSKDGVINHLAALEPDPHLAEALPLFASRVSQSEDPVEAIVIMPADALEDPAVTQALGCLSAARVYLVTVDRSGEFRLSERGPRGEKLVRHAMLPVEGLIPNSDSLLQSSDLDRLPAIFRVDRFPLRMPAPLNSNTCWPVDRWGALSITGDGRLLRWTKAAKGATQISDQLPKGELWWIDPETAHGSTSFVYGPSQKPVLYRLSIPRRDLQATALECPTTTGVAFHNGALFCLQAMGVTVVNPQTGEGGRQMAIPASLKWAGGRYFVDRQTNAWLALSYDGHAPALEPLPPFNTKDDHVVHVWDAVGFSEPLALTWSGRLLAAKDDRDKLPELKYSLSGCSVVEASHDGKRLLVSGHQLGSPELLELVLNLRPQFGPLYTRGIDARIAAVARPATIRKRFRSIGITDEGDLALRATKSVVVLEHQQGMPVLHQQPRGVTFRGEQDFQDVEPRHDFRYHLSVATWPTGDRAILDSRGLLHLQPANIDTPEVTLVLAEGEMTGWRSDAVAFGKPYFLPESGETTRRAAPLRKVYQETVAKFLESIRAGT